jgi:hypothetical protein
MYNAHKCAIESNGSSRSIELTYYMRAHIYTHIHIHALAYTKLNLIGFSCRYRAGPEYVVEPAVRRAESTPR